MTPEVVLLLPLAAVLGLGVLRLAGRTTSEAAASWSVGLAAGVQALAALALALDVARHGPRTVPLAAWVDVDGLDLSLALTLDAPPLLFVAAAAGLVALSTWFSRGYLHREPAFLTVHLGLALLATSITLVATASSLALVFAGWELAGLASGLLIATYPERRTASEAGARALLTNRPGDAALLGATVVAAATAGTTDPALLVGHPVAGLVAAGLVLPALSKAGQVPFTPWVERAVEGPTPTSALFYGGVATHLGLVLLVRAEPLLPWALRGVVVAVAAATLLHAALASLAQPDVKRRLVLRSVAILSVALAVVALGQPALGLGIGLVGAIGGTTSILLAPSWLALRRLRPLAPPPGALAGRAALQGLAAERFGLEARGDALASALVDGAAHLATRVEERLVQPLLGAAAPGIDALAGFVEREEGALELPGGDASDAWAHGVLSRLTHGIADGVHALEDRVIARGIGVALPERGQRVGNRLAAFEHGLQGPLWLGALVLVSLVVAWWGGGR